MEWVVTLAYIVGALLTHCYIYKEARAEDVEHETANIISILWPFALCLYSWLMLESLIKWIIDYARNKK